MWTIRTILHPTDFQAPSEGALRIACSLASTYDAQLVIVHVFPPPIVLPDAMIRPFMDSGVDELRETLQRMEVPNEEVSVIRRVEEGGPVAEILDLALLCRADLIVMGTNGGRGLRRRLLGSVTEEVVRKARCPVLTASLPAAESPSEPDLQRTLASAESRDQK